MTTNNEKQPIVIGVGGFARSGKDTFVKVAKNILKANGYSCIKLAFADALKEEIDPFLREHYNISAWTDDTDEKNIIRPYLVAHGCGKRNVSNGKYWVDKIDEAIESIHFNEDVIFISDCRFPNEADWIHGKWNGWFVHLKKYSAKIIDTKKGEVPNYRVGPSFTGPDKNGIMEERTYDAAPNEEERLQDPKCIDRADAWLHLENVIEREFRLTGNKITPESLVDNNYLITEITKCLAKCPFLTIQNQPKAKLFWSSAENLTKTVSLEKP